MELNINHDPDFPIIEMIRNYLQKDEHFSDETVDINLSKYAEVFKTLFAQYINAEHTNHLQARELALNEIRRRIMNSPIKRRIPLITGL